MVSAMPLLRLLGFLFDLLVYPLRALKRGRVVDEGTFITLVIDGALADVIPKPHFWERRAQKAVSLHDVSELVDHVIADPRVRGILITIKSLSAGMASAVAVLRANRSSLWTRTMSKARASASASNRPKPS